MAEFERSGCSRPHREDSESAITPGDLFASVTLIALTVAMAVTAFYGAHYVLSEIARQSTAHIFRMFGGMP